tara:strand:+ start:4025 stop:4198 length:174 start_codon:yes stop_codon:yes gene_type:complete
MKAAATNALINLMKYASINFTYQPIELFDLYTPPCLANDMANFKVGKQYSYRNENQT